MVDYNPTALYRHRVEHDIEMDGTEVFTLDYIRGSAEARVIARRDSAGELTVAVDEITPEGGMSERNLWRATRDFIQEYGDGFGQVDA